MFVKFELTTNRVGCDSTQVYKVADESTSNYLDEIGNDLARDNAEMYGIIDEAREEAEEAGFDFEESECYGYSYEILEGMTEEEIVEEYGDYEVI